MEGKRFATLAIVAFLSAGILGGAVVSFGDHYVVLAGLLTLMGLFLLMMLLILLVEEALFVIKALHKEICSSLDRQDEAEESKEEILRQFSPPKPDGQ